MYILIIRRIGHLALAPYFIDQSVLGGYYNQYYAGRFHFHGTFFLVPILGLVDM